MTSFVGMFGLMGAVYLFSSNAASPDAASATANNNTMIWLLAGLIAVAIIAVLIVIANRKK